MPDAAEHTEYGMEVARNELESVEAPTEEQDTFYNDEVLEEDADGIDLDAILDGPGEEEYIEDNVLSEDFKLSSSEQEELERLLSKKSREDLIMQTYKALENRPSDEQIADWKKRFGDVYLVSLSEYENFLFRPLKRQEWNQLTSQIMKLPENKKTEAIVMKGVVFPKLSQSNVAVLTAGAPETIRNLILEASNFIDPERAVQLVRKL